MTVKIAALTLASFAAAGAFYSLLRAQETPMLSVWDGVYTNEQAERGRSLYREHCEDCHGIALEGDVESAPLTGGVFQTNWNSVPLGKLYQRIRRDMPADKPGSLSPETCAAVLALILKANGFPPGDAELVHNADFLNQIRFDSVKPAKKK